MTDVVETSAAEQLEKAVEAAGFVHPTAPVAMSSGSLPKPSPEAVAKMAEVEVAPSPKDRLAEIAQELTKASPSGVEALAAELAGLVGTL